MFHMFNLSLYNHDASPFVLQMYKEVQHALLAAGEDDSVVVTVITGAGDYYCSGNDLSNFAQIPPEGPQKLAAEAKKILLWVSNVTVCICL